MTECHREFMAGGPCELMQRQERQEGSQQMQILRLGLGGRFVHPWSEAPRVPSGRQGTRSSRMQPGSEASLHTSTAPGSSKASSGKGLLEEFQLWRESSSWT